MGMPEQTLKDRRGNRVKGEEEWPNLCKPLSIFSRPKLVLDKQGIAHLKKRQSSPFQMKISLSWVGRGWYPQRRFCGRMLQREGSVGPIMRFLLLLREISP